MRFLQPISIFVLLFGLALGCGDEATGNPDDERTTLSGALQKGPFIVGSTVLVSTIDDLGNPTGEVFSTRTTNDLGEFVLEHIPLTKVSIEGTGFYFNEVTGLLSTASITLRAFTDTVLQAGRPTYLNLATHLAYDRTAALLEDPSPVIFPDNLDPSERYTYIRTWAVREILGEVGLDETTYLLDTTGDQLDIFGDDDIDNAMSLALGAIVAQAAQSRPGPTDANLQQLINTISIDMSDGSLDAGLHDELIQAHVAVDGDAVMAHLQQRLDELNITDRAPVNIHRALNQDFDAAVNLDDNCPGVANDDQADSDDDGIGDACDCGNDVVNEGEGCDDGNDIGGDGCSADCQWELPAGWSCDTGLFGDAVCDCACGGLDYDCPDALAASCERCSLCGSGTLADCLYHLRPDDNTLCLFPECGDGIAQTQLGEACDFGGGGYPPDLAGATCESQGQLPGTLGCNMDCTFNTDACDGGCGEIECDNEASSTYYFDPLGNPWENWSCQLDAVPALIPAGHIVAVADWMFGAGELCGAQLEITAVPASGDCTSAPSITATVVDSLSGCSGIPGCGTAGFQYLEMNEEAYLALGGDGSGVIAGLRWHFVEGGDTPTIHVATSAVTTQDYVEVFVAHHRYVVLSVEVRDSSSGSVWAPMTRDGGYFYAISSPPFEFPLSLRVTDIHSEVLEFTDVILGTPGGEVHDTGVQAPAGRGGGSESLLGFLDETVDTDGDGVCDGAEP